MTVDEFWESFKKHYNIDKSRKYIECFHFDLTEEWANKLLELVMSGKKKATASSLYHYELTGGRLPQVNDYNIVTDWDGNPHCVIRTTEVTILPFNEITFDICKREGEDENLESWQQGHRHFFTEDGKEMGYEFSETMPVVFEDFDVMFKLIDGDVDYDFLYKKHVDIYLNDDETWEDSDDYFNPMAEAIFRDSNPWGMTLDELFDEDDDE